MNIKKVVAAALILSSMTAVSASAAEFNDIKGHWAEDIINELADRNIIHGVSDTEFNPDVTVTRAEFLKMALGTVGIADVPYRSGECLDVTASDWYGGCVQSALDKGLIPENMLSLIHISAARLWVWAKAIKRDLIWLRLKCLCPKCSAMRPTCVL